MRSDAQLFWNPREGLVLYFSLWLTFFAIKLLRTRAYPLDTLVRQDVNFYVTFTTAPVRDIPCVRTETFRVRTGQTCMGLSSPLPIGTFLQFAPTESTCCLNFGRNVHPIGVQVVTVLPNVEVMPSDLTDLLYQVEC